MRLEELGFNYSTHTVDSLHTGNKRAKRVLENLLAQKRFSVIREDNLTRFLAGAQYEDFLLRFDRRGCEKVSLFGSTKTKYNFKEHNNSDLIDPRSVLKGSKLSAYEDHRQGFYPANERFAFTIPSKYNAETKIAVLDVQGDLPNKLTIYGGALNIGNVSYTARFFYERR